MELLVPEAPTAAANCPAPAYPTLAESWGILGRYLLVTLVVGVPLYLVFKKALALSLGTVTKRNGRRALKPSRGGK